MNSLCHCEKERSDDEAISDLRLLRSPADGGIPRNDGQTFSSKPSTLSKGLVGVPSVCRGLRVESSLLGKRCCLAGPTELVGVVGLVVIRAELMPDGPAEALRLQLFEHVAVLRPLVVLELVEGEQVAVGHHPLGRGLVPTPLMRAPAVALPRIHVGVVLDPPRLVRVVAILHPRLDLVAPLEADRVDARDVGLDWDVPDEGQFLAILVHGRRVEVGGELVGHSAHVHEAHETTLDREHLDSLLLCC